MLGSAPASPLTSVPGWMTDEEENMLARYASMLKPGAVIVNIGVEYGRSVSVLAKIAETAEVYGVELNPIPDCDANLNEANLTNRPTIFVGDSKVVGREWNRGEIDLLFIDGAHEFENVKGDIEAWIPHVKHGGYVLFHDVAQASNKMPHYLHFEVTRAISEWTQAQSDFEAVGAVDTMAVFHRAAKVGGLPKGTRGFDHLVTKETDNDTPITDKLPTDYPIEPPVGHAHEYAGIVSEADASPVDEVVSEGHTTTDLAEPSDNEWDSKDSLKNKPADNPEPPVVKPPAKSGSKKKPKG